MCTQNQQTLRDHWCPENQESKVKFKKKKQSNENVIKKRLGEIINKIDATANRKTKCGTFLVLHFIEQTK